MTVPRPEPGPASNPLATAVSWAAACGVEVRRWDGLGSDGSVPSEAPVLFLVDAGVAPPSCTSSQDWIRLPLDPEEVPFRCARLLAIAGGATTGSVTIDADDVLHVADQRRALTPIDARVLRLLLARPGAVVSYRVIADAAWPSPRTDSQADAHAPIKRLRERLEGLPLRIESVRRRGVRLVRAGSAAEAEVGGDED